MLFKTPELGLQWIRLHPQTRAAVTSIDAQAQLWRLPEITITDLARTWNQNIAIYTEAYLNDGHPPAEALSLAEAKLSYHLEGVETACDFRSSKEPYAPEDSERIYGWMREQFPRDRWEVLLHNVGKGLHFHLAYKDNARLTAWAQAHPSGKGTA